MGSLLRGIIGVVFWLVVAALVLAALDSDARRVLEDYIPFFDVADPLIDWLADFLEDLWDAIRG